MHNNLLQFTNRSLELSELKKLAKHSGLVVIFGRRRVGKTRLITQWIDENGGLYSQAIESDPHIQLSQIFDDIKSQLKTTLTPKTWPELFEILELQERPIVFCIDEFPYLVSSDPSLPSVMQKWLDHSKKRNIQLILMGSSNHMMHDLFLNHSAPLFGRAIKVLHLETMSYVEFCSALELSRNEESFLKFSLVGGIPKYWEFINPQATSVEAAENLYFGFAPYMESEPNKLFSDEQIKGLLPLSILECIGRGAHKPSEIAKRMEIPQTHLSRSIQQLLDASIIIREIPFGESLRNSKKSLYKIKDPAIRFWYSVYSPHRVLWNKYNLTEKKQLLRLHASTVFEDYCRNIYPSSARYWDKNIEFDFIREPSSSDPLHIQKKKSDFDIIVSEVKFTFLTDKQKSNILRELEMQWQNAELSKKYKAPCFEVLDLNILEKDKNTSKP